MENKIIIMGVALLAIVAFLAVVPVAVMADVTSGHEVLASYRLSGDHAGSITLYSDHEGSATIDGNGPYDFEWQINSRTDNGAFDGVATYWFWQEPFEISADEKTITSSEFPGEVAVLV